MKSSYLTFALRRIAQAILVILLAYVATFLVISVLPGDPVTSMLNNPENGFSPDQVHQIVAYYRLDQPIPVQLWHALSRFVTGDLGLSLRTNLPVSHMITGVAGSTFALAGEALGVAIVLAFAIGYGTYALPRWAGRDVLRAFPSLFLSVPNYVIGLIFLVVFSFHLGLFSVIDAEGPTATFFAALTLGIPVSAQLAEVVIANLDHEASLEYASVARSRGLTQLSLFVRHLLKPSSLPVVTVIALIVGELLGGAVLTEQIFGRNGLGSLVQQSVTTQDTPVLQAVVSLSAAIFVVVNLAADLVYPLLDPRVRGTRTSTGPSLPAPGRTPGPFTPSALGSEEAA
ncbi:ABC transporter permease [Nocardioides sp. BP30]|uniref:ABC transporter permease n=1 Tax=Nocardioides sp. BP30 TaxID=3036374 RepID=UPI0024683B96|nr:ABC transporter permease [Nocardioides sp. BP30]WGL52030.1 ABC transporter permease [Nocardioides sp. BP30]